MKGHDSGARTHQRPAWPRVEFSLAFQLSVSVLVKPRDLIGKRAASVAHFQVRSDFVPASRDAFCAQYVELEDMFFNMLHWPS
jgi:hypothetical protein